MWGPEAAYGPALMLDGLFRGDLNTDFYISSGEGGYGDWVQVLYWMDVVSAGTVMIPGYEFPAPTFNIH